MMKFLGSKISLKKSSLKFVAELDFLEFQKRTLFLSSLEIFVSIYCSIMFPSTLLIPLCTNPKFVLRILRSFFMCKTTEKFY